MADSAELFKQSELSMASYGDLTIGSPNKQELQRIGMAEEQADDFIKRWRVVDQYRDSSGAAATVFERLNDEGQPTGQRYLAIRGTESPGDINASERAKYRGDSGHTGQS